ncbi:MAG: TOMM precursor leader peptide-binding protein [Halobacteriales archaeon]
MTESEPTRGYPRLNPAFVPVVTEEAVHFRAGPWSGPIYTLESDGGTEQLIELLGLLDGTQSIAAIADALDEPQTDLEEVVEQLRQNGIVVETTGTETTKRSGDVAGYLRLADHLPAGSTTQLEESTVTVIVDGELGSMTVDQLDRLGVEEITTLPVEGTDTTAVTDAALERTIATADFAVVTGTRPRPSLLERINQETQRHETPWIAGQVLGYDGLIGPTVIPGESPCYRCFSTRVAANVRDPESYPAFERRAESVDRSPGPGLAAFSAIIAGHLAIETMTWVCAGVANTVGRVLRYDFHDLSVEASDVLRLPRCPDCGQTELPDTPRHVPLAQLLDDLNEGMPDA